MLAVEVAAGIVLAYIIIVNQKKLLTFAVQTLIILAILLVIGTIIWAGARLW